MCVYPASKYRCDVMQSTHRYILRRDRKNSTHRHTCKREQDTCKREHDTFTCEREHDTFKRENDTLKLLFVLFATHLRHIQQRERMCRFLFWMCRALFATHSTKRTNVSFSLLNVSCSLCDTFNKENEEQLQHHMCVRVCVWDRVCVRERPVAKTPHKCVCVWKREREREGGGRQKEICNQK